MNNFLIASKTELKDKDELVRSEVFLMDCMEGMKQYPDKYFDLACVDPVYGIYQSAYLKSKPKGAATRTKKYNNLVFRQEKSNEGYFNELIRVSKDQIVWGANYFSHSLPEGKQWIFWDKDTQAKYGDGELAYTSFDGAIRKFKFTWNGMIQENMKDKEIRVHPTQKPVALYDWLFKNYSKKGMSVLDTHLGSGSSRISADKYGLNFTGYEIVDDYFKASEKRYKEYKSQLTMF